MSHQHLLKNISNQVLTLTLNRPERLNAFSTEMFLELISALKDAQTNPEVRAIVIKGSGRSFSAGGDINDMGSDNPISLYDFVYTLNEGILTMRDTEKPIIAAVHGYAAGAGASLALAADLIVAAENTKFALSFSQVGLISDGGGSYHLTKLIGPYLAKQFYFSAEPILVDRLYELGVVNQIVPSEKLDEEVSKLATKLANGPSRAYGLQKKIINHAVTATLEDILEQERVSQVMMNITEDHKEGIAAFMEKRQPVFKGK
ncbi:enoyl-CoA hydratase-related protein [Neobacillus niacini]|uniref:enoyl-CoA hydratase/isomerase family protein n=1 Tax=Neobacillus niacini TaxID=86668 RepID=UPI002FFF7F22